MNKKSERYILNLEEFNYFSNERNDIYNNDKFDYLDLNFTEDLNFTKDLNFTEDPSNITNKQNIEILIKKLEENIIQSMREIIYLKKIIK